MGRLSSIARDRECRSGAVRSRGWRQRSPSEKAVLVTLGSIELALTAAAAVDLYRRPRESVRGPKAMWWPTIFVQPVGPVAYLVLGRRR